MAKVITTPLNINTLKKVYENLKEDILNDNIKPNNTDFPNINHWFDEQTIKDLEILKKGI